MAPSRPQEKIRAKICRIENFAYLCNAQAIFRELSSVGSERLPYKQRVGGSNPSAPTPEAFHESERLFSYIHLPSFRLILPHHRYHINGRAMSNIKAAKEHPSLKSILHTLKRREKHLLRILRSFGQDTIAECITRQRRMGTRQQKRPPLIAEVSELGYQDSNLE